MRTIVVGLGNPILGDDGVGWKVANEVMGHLPEDASVDVTCLSVGGISLMEYLIGYDQAIIVDAFATDAPVGSISVLRLDQLPNYSAFHTTSSHDTSLQKAMELGKAMGFHLPDNVMIVGIATRQVFDFSEDLSPPVARVVHSVGTIVLDMLKESVLQVEVC
ncbi:MAG TPA: hydrogenase maturation protease [Anaerolineales bacterium]|nr:hydrogenase maturation protease [Anaerolineales bacterium]